MRTSVHRQPVAYGEDGDAVPPAPPAQHDAPARTPGRTAAVRYAAQILGAAGGFVTAVFTARALGPEGKGAIAFLLVVSNLGAQWGTLGLHDGASYLLRQRQIGAETLAAAYLALSLVLGGVLGVATAAGMHAWGEAWTGFPFAASVCAVTGATIGIRMWSLLARGVMLACHRTTLVIALDLAETLVPGIVFVAAMLAHVDPFVSAVAAYAGAFVVVAVACLAMLGGGAARALPSLHLRTVREICSYSVGTQWRQLAWVLIFRLDQILVSRFLGVAGLGIYSMAATFADMLARVPDAASWVLLPKAAAMRASEARRFTSASVRTALIATAGFAPFYIAALAVVTPMLLPPSFSRVWLVAAALAPAVIVSSVWRVLSAALVARGGALAAAGALSGGVVTLAIGNVLLLPVLGLYGAAITAVVAHGVGALLMARAYRRSHERGTVVTMALAESPARS